MKSRKRERCRWLVGFSRGMVTGGEAFPSSLRVKLRVTLALLGALGLAGWASPEARATVAVNPSWEFQETPLVRTAGDQTNPSVSDGSVFFRDGVVSGGGLVRYDLASGLSTPLFGGGVSAGPDADAGAVAWQDGALNACLGNAAGDSSRCLALPEATQLALSGTLAVSAHANSTIRLINFETMRSRILDSSTTSGGRYDPDIVGNRAVWVKERGYAGKYYEPLIVSYDILTDTLTYDTKMGGGETPAGESVYERRSPVLAGDRIMYQQRLRGVSGWDIFETAPDSYGQLVVEAPGDQVNPALDDRFLVYQDNRSAGVPASGAGAGEWDIYMKDLVSGEEIPVCTAAGDQMNPVVRGDRIVWEDNRNGDWDIYSATIVAAVPDVPPQVEEPRLTLTMTNALWESYAQYMAGEVTVHYAISNKGLGAARETTIRRIAVWPLTVTLTGALPAPVAEIAPGQKVMLQVHFHLQPGDRHFRTLVTASCQDTAGTELWFPRPLVN